MKKIIQNIISGFSIFIFFNCGYFKEKIEEFFAGQNRTFLTENLYKQYHDIVSDVGDLNDQKIKNYICAYRTLKEKSIDNSDYFKTVIKVRGEISELMNIYPNIDNDLKKCNINNMIDFIKLNAKVAWAWNIYQGQKGLDIYINFQDKVSKNIQNQMEQALKNPNLTEEQKKQLQKQWEESLQKVKDENKEQMEKNKRWAEWTLNLVKPLTNDKDIEVIKKHEQELLEVFTGLSSEQLSEIQKYQADLLGIKE